MVELLPGRTKNARVIRWSGGEIKAKVLARGGLSTAFLGADGHVYLFTMDSAARTVLIQARDAAVRAGDGSEKHLPELQWIGSWTMPELEDPSPIWRVRRNDPVGGGFGPWTFDVYRMPVYGKVPWGLPFSTVVGALQRRLRGRLGGAQAALILEPSITPALHKAVGHIVAKAARRDSNWVFDVPRYNLAVDADNNIVLLDVLTARLRPLVPIGEGLMNRRELCGRRNQDPRRAALKILTARRNEPTAALNRAGELDFAAWLKELYEDEYIDVLRDQEWLEDEAGNWAEEVLDVTVREDGRLEVDTLPSHVRRFVRGLPIVLMHHTATGKKGRLEEQIRAQGLRRQPRPARADSLSTGAGVYLTSALSGPVVSGYLDKARRKHSGRHLSLEVVIHDVSELIPDPDDADITSGRRQWIVDYVPPSDILP